MENQSRLQEMCDRHDIWATILRYTRGIDRMDPELIRSCYWDDAVDDHQMFVGSPDEFIDWAMQAVARHQASFHAVSNHSCELDGDDAYCETYYNALGSGPADRMMSLGRYIDHFQRRDGVWKIANRICVIESVFTLTEHPLAAGILAGDTRFGPLPTTSRDRTDLSYARPIAPRRPPA